MTFEQFDKTGWTGNMKCIFQGEADFYPWSSQEEKDFVASAGIL